MNWSDGLQEIFSHRGVYVTGGQISAAFLGVEQAPAGFVVHAAGELQGEVPVTVAGPFVVRVVSVVEDAAVVESVVLSFRADRALRRGPLIFLRPRGGEVALAFGGDALRTLLVFDLQLHVEDATVPVAAALVSSAKAEAVPEPVAVPLRAFHRQVRGAE